MVKFSVIVPVYNTEKYLSNCLDSILSQTYKDFELIIVNDGSKDNSQEIIDKYVKKDKRVKGYLIDNGGPSIARNYGVEKSSGEYLVFIDSDDDIDKRLLEELNKEIDKNKCDVIRYQLNKITDIIDQDKSEVFENIPGVEAFKLLSPNRYFGAACSCAYNREFFTKNKFKYEEYRLHEDYGLTPYIYMKADKVSSIAFGGYNYYYRDNSIMTTTDDKKELKKAKDMLFLYDLNIERINKEKDIKEEDKQFFRSYMTNGLINKCSSLEGDLFDEFYKEISKRDLSKNLLSDTLPRKIKRLIYKIMPKYYIKHFK